ncbi:MAG TPA: TIGR03668 family PPOX class F420-dependent oxidoreductase [Trebonia sp.]|nr:TIGR03668 family PPOX class F420-dependent oxidoreductase [Trebonia sp.]
MNLSTQDARALLATVRVARLATVSPDGQPHLVPVTFAADGDRVYIAIDHKPKTTTNLKRLRNISHNPRVSLLADHYEDDWAQLWWVRVDGQARVLAGADREGPVDLLASKYGQYAEQRPDGPVISIEVTRWTAWASSLQATTLLRASGGKGR